MEKCDGERPYRGDGLDLLLGPSCARIVRALHHAGEATATELAERLGFTANGARRHLKKLETTGMATCRVQPQGRGRPAHRFHLTPAGERLFPSAVLPAAVFLSELALEERDQQERDELARELFDRVLGEAGGPERQPGSALAERRKQMLGCLERAGFVPQVIDDSTEFCLHHCPFGQLVQSFPELCTAECEWYTDVLGVPVRRVAWRLEDGSCCRYRIEEGAQTG